MGGVGEGAATPNLRSQAHGQTPILMPDPSIINPQFSECRFIENGQMIDPTRQDCSKIIFSPVLKQTEGLLNNILLLTIVTSESPYFLFLSRMYIHTSIVSCLSGKYK